MKANKLFSILVVIIASTIPALSFSLDSSIAAMPTTTTTTATTTTTTTTSQYQIRPYNPALESDVLTLQEICAGVYGGSDYLPLLAASYVDNPDCSFLALTTATTTSLSKKKNDNNDSSVGSSSNDVVTTTTMSEQDVGFGSTLAVVANYKRLQSQNIAWIEAVRTHPSYQNQGLATTLLHAIINLSKKEKESTKIFTCTIQSNKGMLRALAKVGFVQCNIIHTLKFDVLRKLPGWSSSAEDHNIIPLPLLDALDLTYLISPTVKTIPPSAWCTITTELSLIDWLTLCKVEGGCSGYLPGLYEYIVPGPNRNDLKESLEYGLVVAIDVSSTTTQQTTTTNNNDILSNAGHAILAFTRDTRITSLKSKWVCSIVAYTQIAFEVAIWYAHSPDMTGRRMKSTTLTACNDNIHPTNDNHTNDTSATTMPFCLVFDHAIPIHDGTVAYALPRVTDECVVLSYEHERNKQP